MLITDAKRKTNMDYDRKNTKLIGMKLNRKTDADILEHLATKDNIQGYLKELIRNDMMKGERTMKIQFEAGTDAAGRGINYMLCLEDRDLYAEIEVPEGASEDFGYFILKQEIIALAADKGIGSDELEFWYDGQENNLAPDADGNIEC